MEKIKKSASILIIFCMLISMLPVSVFAEATEIVNGTCGEDLWWTLDSAGVLTIGGSGSMTNYTSGSWPYSSDTRSPWYEQRNLITQVVIEYGVTNIGNYAFNDLYNMTNVLLPDSVTAIGRAAFYYCSSLREIHLPASLKSIGNAAFFECSSLEAVFHPDLESWCKIDFQTSSSQGQFNYSNPLYYANNLYINGELLGGNLVIPEGLTDIGQFAFYNCSALTSVTIPKSMEVIGYEAFAGCNNLTAVYISDLYSWCEVDFELSYYHDDIYNYDANPLNIAGKLYLNGTLVTDLVIPNGITEIKNAAFIGAKCLQSVVFPESVDTIGVKAFRSCANLKTVTLTNSIETIERSAFQYSGLKSIDIPNSVLYLGSDALYGCTALESAVIGDGVTVLWDETFYGCTSLQSITLGAGITQSGYDTFKGCTALQSVYVSDLVQWCNMVYTTYYYMDHYKANPLSFAHNLYIDGALVENLEIPTTVNTVGRAAFYGASCLQSATIPDNVTKIDAYVFAECDNLGEVTILNPECSIYGHYETLGGRDKTRIYGYTGSTAQSYAETYGYTFVAIDGDDDSSNLSIPGLTIDKKFNNFYTFLGDSHVYNMDSPNAALYLEFNQISIVDTDDITPADIVWTSSDETVLKIICSGTEEDMYVNLRVEGLTEGTATLTATNPDGETLSFDVTVVKPNTLAFTNIYDTKQYYSSGAFYSAASSISDSVEIFVQFENALIDGYPCKVETDLAKNVSDVEPITLTAIVSGSDLSFDRNSYQNTYTTTYDPIKFDNCVYDILMLFPYDVDSYEAGTSYTVNLTLESDSFAEPIEEIYNFTVYDAEKQRVAEHINFTNNSTYKVSKQNIYGTNMLELKDDPEYNWSVVTSLDFDNYYEIVLADLLVDMLDVYQVNTSIVPTVLKEWHGTYKSLLGDVTTMVNDSYSDVLDVSEMKIDKVLKVSKYTKASDGIYADDDVYQVVLDMFGNVGNVDKIQTFFAAVDDTKSAFSIVKLTGDLVKDFVAWGNSIAVLNAFVETDENFKQVFRQVANNIPDSEKKMKEAIEDYLNYSEDFAGQFSEIYDSFCDLGVDVALDTFDGIVGEKLWDWAAAKAVGWIGKIPISGGTATFSSTTAYASLTTAIGSVTTGISLGLCLSDLICDSSDKAAEMSKIIAMSEYAPYIIQALEYYEDNLYSAADNNAVDLFEKAFGLHQASQSYIMDHTVKALEVKGESILYQILGNDDYDRLVAEILVQKNAVDSMDCCGTLTTDTVVNNKKVIAIKCPVDVYVYSEDGSEVVCIINDGLQFAEEGITVYIRDRAKYIALPTNQTYSVKIVATDTGTMDYIVQEFDEELQLYKTVEKQDVALVNGRLFVGEVAPQLGLEEASYVLTYEGIMIGDMDNDGEISDWDAILLNRYLAGWGVELDSLTADIDGDGEVSDWDAIVLERYLAGWNVTIG